MIGIIILNYNTSDDTIECVNSIMATCNMPYRIYIVDNNSSDNSYEEISCNFEESDNIIIMQADKNGGFSYGNNIGIKKAIADGCDYILISNPDVIYYDETIQTLYKDVVSDPRIGVVGPSLQSLDQSESQLLRKTYTPGIYLCSKKPFLYFSKIIKRLKTEYDYPSSDCHYPFIFKGMVRGCCFMISSKIFLELGLFDDNVFLYSEEWIIAKKIEEKGYYCAYDGRVKALHKEATSTKKNGTAFQTYHLYLSAFYYLQEYCKMNWVLLFFFHIQNIVNFTLKSILHKDYRYLYTKFIKTQKKLYHREIRRIEK